MNTDCVNDVSRTDDNKINAIELTPFTEGTGENPTFVIEAPCAVDKPPSFSKTHRSRQVRQRQHQRQRHIHDHHRHAMLTHSKLHSKSKFKSTVAKVHSFAMSFVNEGIFGDEVIAGAGEPVRLRRVFAGGGSGRRGSTPAHLLAYFYKLF